MPKPERLPDDLTRSQDTCVCGESVPPHHVTPTRLWVAVHQARHLAYLKPRSTREWRDLAGAQKVAIDEYEAQCRWLRQEIHMRDDVIDELEGDKAVLLRLSEDQWDRIQELEAELDHEHRPPVRDGDG